MGWSISILNILRFFEFEYDLHTKYELLSSTLMCFLLASSVFPISWAWRNTVPAADSILVSIIFMSMKMGTGAKSASSVNHEKNHRFYNLIGVYGFINEGWGMPTFGQRVKQAWKNIEAMKQKDNDKNKQEKTK